MITPTQHEKNEWSRMAQAAYRANRNDVGHRYSVAASLPHNGQIKPVYFYSLQSGYHAWLVFGEWPTIVEAIEAVR